jgi:hypothetical protein
MQPRSGTEDTSLLDHSCTAARNSMDRERSASPGTPRRGSGPATRKPWPGGSPSRRPPARSGRPASTRSASSSRDHGDSGGFSVKHEACRLAAIGVGHPSLRPEVLLHVTCQQRPWALHRVDARGPRSIPVRGTGSRRSPTLATITQHPLTPSPYASRSRALASAARLDPIPPGDRRASAGLPVSAGGSGCRRPLGVSPRHGQRGHPSPGRGTRGGGCRRGRDPAPGRPAGTASRRRGPDREQGTRRRGSGRRPWALAAGTSDEGHGRLAGGSGWLAADRTGRSPPRSPMQRCRAADHVGRRRERPAAGPPAPPPKVPYCRPVMTPFGAVRRSSVTPVS